MIARLWHGQATSENAPHYRQHAIERVFPSLAELRGHQGAYLLTRETDGQVEFLAVTLWDNIEAIKEFSGNDPEVAVVEPEARAVLSGFDDFARHYEVVCASHVSEPDRATGRSIR
jgi:heme-degrading monooxygenase HmoA